VENRNGKKESARAPTSAANNPGKKTVRRRGKTDRAVVPEIGALATRET